MFTRFSLYTNWLRATSLYIIYRNSLNLDYPRDSVNTAIIHMYSTLPRNGRIHRVSRKYRFIPGGRTCRFARVGGIREQETESAGVGRVVAERQKIDVDCRNRPRCPTLIRPIFRYACLVPKRSKSIHRKTLGHSICDILDCRYLLKADFP